MLLSTADLAAVDVRACLCVPDSQPTILDTLMAASGDGWPNLLHAQVGTYSAARCLLPASRPAQPRFEQVMLSKVWIS